MPIIDVSQELLNRIKALLDEQVFKHGNIEYNVGCLQLPPHMVTVSIEVNDVTETSLSTGNPHILDVFVTYYENLKK